MLRFRMWVGAALAIGGALATPNTGTAQTAPDRTLSIMAGGFSYDYDSDQMAPMGALRLDRRISNVLIAEVGVSYARATLDIVDHTPPDPVSREGTGSLGTATVGVQAELPLAYLRPYVGIATGLFVKAEHGQPGANRFMRTTTEFPVGVRIPVAQRVVARAETRLRFDEHTGGDSSVNAELTFGLGWKF